MTMWLTVVTMALADSGRAAARLAAAVAARAWSRRGHGLRRVLPRDAAHPADLLGLLRPAGLSSTCSCRSLATAIVGLTCNISAFNSETFRAGIVSIRQGQWNAGLALGMSDAAGVRPHRPAAGGDARAARARLDLGVAVQGHLARLDHPVAELSYVALQLRAETYRILEVLTAMAALYWLMGYPQAKLVDWIHRRFKVVE